MRIIFSNYDDLQNPYYAGGGAHAIHQVAKRLAQSHTVTVLTASYPNSTDCMVDGVTYKRIGSHTVGPKIGQLLFLLLVPLYAWKLQKNYDIWFESFTPPISTSCVPLFTKKRVIGVLHNLAGQYMQKKYHLPFAFLEKVGLSFYRELIALTPHKQKLVQSLGFAKKVWLIPNGIETPKRIEKKQQTPYILYIGRLDIVQKGIDLLLEAFAKVAHTISHQLYIAGDTTPEERKKITEMISKNKLEKRVKLLGKVSGDQKAQAFTNAAFLVLPSRFEGQGITFLEGISYEKPILCFDIPDLAWLEDDVVYKCGHPTAQNLAGGIRTLATNATRAAQLAQTVVQKKDSYTLTWDSVAKKYQAVLKVGL